MSNQGWVGVDLDGTLAVYDGWRGFEHIGEPITPMVDRVKMWLGQDIDVRIFTARVSDPIEGPEAEGHIARWCVRHIGRQLPVTCCKDFGMVELWDDRCVQVEFNTGRPMVDRPEEKVTP